LGNRKRRRGGEVEDGKKTNEEVNDRHTLEGVEIQLADERGNLVVAEESGKNWES